MEAKNCQIAGGAKKLTGVQPELMEKICREVEGEAIGSLSKSLRLVLLQLPWLKRSGESMVRWSAKF